MRIVDAVVRRTRARLRRATRAPVFESPAGGSFEEFLAQLLARESTLAPERLASYIRNYRRPVVRYPRVSAPGRVIRDRVSGRPISAQQTVGEYFATLGVDTLFDPSSSASIRRMQYAVTNALGFVGYQFGESALISAGYYRPEVVRVPDERGGTRAYESYYVGSIADAVWRDGRTEIVYRRPGTEQDVLATDVNRWRGTFTGKNGISSLEHLKDPACQERVIRDQLCANQAVLADIFAAYSPGRRSVRCTWSAVLAAAHLCGPYAAAAFVLTGTDAHDEFNTAIRTYFNDFGGFATPFDR